MHLRDTFHIHKGMYIIYVLKNVHGNFVKEIAISFQLTEQAMKLQWKFIIAWIAFTIDPRW